MYFKIKNLILLILFLNFPLSSALYCETIKIATIDWYPYCTIDNNEQPGLLIEYVQTIYNRVGIEVEFEVLPWSRAIYYTEKGIVDALLAPSKNEAPNLVYPENIIGTQRFCFFNLANDPWVYTRPESVIGKSIIHVQGVLPEELKKFENDNIFIRKSYDKDFIKESIAFLFAEKIDSILLTDYTMINFLNDNGLMNLVKFAGCVTEENLYLAFSPLPSKKEYVDNLIEVFDREIKILIEEKYFEKLLEKYNMD